MKIKNKLIFLSGTSFGYLLGLATPVVLIWRFSENYTKKHPDSELAEAWAKVKGDIGDGVQVVGNDLRDIIKGD